jgi:HAD superfamily hydrolase (TIGR01549 family)
MKKIKILVWDLDGTLSPQDDVIEHQFRKKVLKILAEKLETTFAQAKEKFIAREKELKGTTKTLNSLGVDGFGIIAQVQQEVDWEKLLKKDQHLVKILNDLNQYRHILLTDNTKKSGERKLKALAIPRGIFEKKFYGIDLQLVKPNPNLFSKVILYTQLEPEKHLMIGDSLEKDILPARSVGMKTCIVGSTTETADYSIKKIYQTVEVLRRING